MMKKKKIGTRSFVTFVRRIIRRVRIKNCSAATNTAQAGSRTGYETIRTNNGFFFSNPRGIKRFVIIEEYRRKNTVVEKIEKIQRHSVFYLIAAGSRYGTILSRIAFYNNSRYYSKVNPEIIDRKSSQYHRGIGRCLECDIAKRT